MIFIQQLQDGFEQNPAAATEMDVIAPAAAASSSSSSSSASAGRTGLAGAAPVVREVRLNFKRHAVNRKLSLLM